MEPLRTDSAETHLVSRSVPIAAPAFRAVLRAAETPRTVWSAPGEATVVGEGAAATLTADGPDRFDAVREAAESLFVSGDVHAGTEAARPRLFGGFGFHTDSTDGPPWEDFPGARFVFPRVQVTWVDDEAWLTVNAVGPEATPETVEARREKAVPEGFWFRDERRDLFLDADVPLPPDAVGAEATARLESGVLEVTIPKASGTVTQVPVEG